MDESRPKLLIVEDDDGVRRQLKWCFPEFDILFAEDRGEALAQVERHEPPVVLLDLGLPPDPANATEGLAALEEILSRAPDTKVIVVTGNDERTTALQAVATGAYDYYQKPVDAETLALIVDRALRLHRLEVENRRLRESGRGPLEGLLAASPQMLQVCRTVERVARSNATVLLTGESGCGKEVVARALHRMSERSDQRLVAINCASIPDTLLESELFGYEKGAFTGATRQTIGRIEYAHTGTLFLDEIGDLPMALQAKLLRFLQERVIERLGGPKPVPVDVRVVCATHRNLRAMIAEGSFREDLYYRVAEITVEIPALRDRPGDAVLLAHAFLRRFSAEERRSVRHFTQEALEAIDRYSWPGNVRELENVVRRAVIMADGPRVSASDLQLSAEDERVRPLDLRLAREVAERETVTRAIGMADGNLARASELLGISRPTLYSLMSKLGMREG